MQMPKVTSEMIDSIREQTVRSDVNGQELYCSQIMKDMKEENPVLYDAIMSSVRMLSERLNLDPSQKEDYINMINILNVAASVYQSIKQQMIADELELTIQ
jgi:uncharacterized protein YoxC